MQYILSGLLLLVATGATAQQGPSFDCAKAESSAEKLVCEGPELARLDRLVARRFDEAVAAIRAADAGAEAGERELRAFQRGWIKGRDECWKAGDALRDCVEASYLRRQGELVAQWMLEPPASAVIWACDGNPANEVVTYFFDTELPSVRFERGDQIDTGVLVPTASGSRYEGSFGRSIWIKGESATYREPDPDGQIYDCTLARTL
jgi:uncharacterized protein